MSATLHRILVARAPPNSEVSLMRTPVGRVVGLWRYPVKSMAGEALTAADVSWHGVAGDRRWAFVRDGQVRSGMPWLTITRHPGMVRYRPWFAEPGRPDTSPTMVRTPSGEEFDVADPALAENLGGGVRAMKLDRGSFDALPLSLITTQSIAAVGAGLDVQRFRPNLVVEAAEGTEDAWVGRVLRVGGMRMRVDARDKRCAVVNVDPATGERDPGVLRAIARDHELCLGVYGTTVEPGHVTVGDPVLIEA